MGTQHPQKTTRHAVRSACIVIVPPLLGAGEPRPMSTLHNGGEIHARYRQGRLVGVGMVGRPGVQALMRPSLARPSWPRIVLARRSLTGT